MKNHQPINPNELNKIIDIVISISNDLVFKKFDISEFERFKGLVDLIVNTVITEKPNNIQIKICELIKISNIEDFRLNIIRRVFAPYAETGMIGFPNNSEKQMTRRFCLNISSKLLILKSRNL